jgi:caa(3)-type oxidase subunit IV
MAEKKKNSGARASTAKASADPKAESHDEGHGAAAPDHGAAAHGAVAHGAAAHGAHKHHAPNYKEYFAIFVVLFVLTVLEVGVTKVPGIAHKLMAFALVGMALTKAAFVGLYYMHLKDETKGLKLTVAIPLAVPALYAFVLITDAAWRLLRW